MKTVVWVVQTKNEYLKIRHLLINCGYKTHIHNLISNEREPIDENFPLEKILFMDDNIRFVSNYCGSEKPSQEVFKKLQESKEPFELTITIK